MTTIDCASCGSAVPTGRLACPTCGELLASVAGRTVSTRYVTREAVDAGVPEPALEPDAGPALDAAAGPAPDLASVPVEHAASPIPPSGSYRPGARFAATADSPLIDPHDPPAPTAWPARPDPVAPRLGDVQAAAAARWASVAASAPSGSAVVATGAGAALSPAVREPFTIPALPVPLAERLVALAAGAIAVAFLLPWGDIVIGAAIVGEPWHRLGILASWHWLAWLGALPVILLATAATAVPAWLRLGAVPIAYGGLVIGLAWPYVLGPIGGAPAPLVAVIASLALVALGAFGVRPAPGPR